MSVTAQRLQSLLLHFTSCIMLRMQNRECERGRRQTEEGRGREMGLSRHFVTSQAVWESRSTILLSVNKT